MRLACVKRAASVDSEPGSNSRLNLLFWMADLMANRSPQFELKLLTKFLLRIQPDCQTSAHCTRDRLRKRIPCRPRKPFGRNQINPGPKFSPLRVGSITTRKLGNLKELLQKGGYRDFSRKILPLPRLAANPTLKSAPPKKARYLTSAFSATRKKRKVPLSAYCHQLL